MFKCILLATALLAIGTNGSSIPDPLCEECVRLGNVADCQAKSGCVWSQPRASCVNGCEYKFIGLCATCDRECRWIPGIISTCIIKWDFHFDICFAVDASESITLPEWTLIRNFFIKGLIDALTPLSCVLGDRTRRDSCPHVGIIQYDSICQTIIPNVSLVDPTIYNEQSYCFDPTIILSHLPTTWHSIVDAMERSVDRASRIGGAAGHTFTLLAVQRCMDLLVNTFNSHPKSLSVLITITDGNPNGPVECDSATCSICGPNPQKEDLITGDYGDNSCYNNPRMNGATFEETNQTDKIAHANTKTILVLLKADVQDSSAFVNDVKLTCITKASNPDGFKYSVKSDLLVNGSQQDLGGIIGNISNLVCEFLSAPPSMAPTTIPTAAPSYTPTRTPSRTPSGSPSSSAPSQAPTYTPTGSPSDSPTGTPSRTPSSTPTETPSGTPTRTPSGAPSGTPTRAPSGTPTGTPTKTPSETPSGSPTKSPSATPSFAPTNEPTIGVCTGPPPDFRREGCSSAVCNNGNAAVTVDPMPTITVNTNTSNTKFCWSITIAKPVFPCKPQNTTFRGVSFMIDECCSLPDFEPLVSISMDGMEYNDCPVVVGQNSPDMYQPGCVRARRPCTATRQFRAGENCSVVMLNDIKVDSDMTEFCMVVPGIDWKFGSRIDATKKEMGRICFENGVNGAMDNICSCADVVIPKSKELCKTTRSPTQSPVPRPTPCQNAVPKDVYDKSCNFPCHAGSMSEWMPKFKGSKYDPYMGTTEFRYCVETDENWFWQYNSCVEQRKFKPIDLSYVIFRIDQCCPFCLTHDHFDDSSPARPMIVNSHGSPYFKIDRGVMCYRFRFDGKIGVQLGKVCLGGGNKCDCVVLPVPSSCDLKKVMDPQCPKPGWWANNNRPTRKPTWRPTNRPTYRPSKRPTRRPTWYVYKKSWKKSHRHQWHDHHNR